MKNTVMMILGYVLIGLNVTYSQQKINESEPIPTDPYVRIGTLKNGLTYYLRANTKPEKKAEMRLVLNVGSILEDDDQLGLAHFIEHMAFNGTKSFEKNKLIDHLQSLGIEFGADLNAHTSFDETVYKLSVPTDNEETFNTSLQILRDWADGITFDSEEIDNERGIVAEELRARSGAASRMYYKSIPDLTNNSRYAERSPIGTVDVIMNSKYEVLKRYYSDWYRPDLMALVLVGDFDVERTEAKIKKMFKSIEAIKEARERIYYEIPSHKSAKISIQTDKEARDVSVTIYHKKENIQVVNLGDLREDLLQRMYSGMLRQRLNEIELMENAPFLSASGGIGKFLGNLDSYYLKANLKENNIKNGIEALLVESERARRYGFTASELDRYKANLLNKVNTIVKEEGKISSSFYLEQYIDNFTDGSPIPSNAFMMEFYKTTFPDISVKEVNKISEKWISEDNMAIVLNGPEKEGLLIPNEDEIVSLLNEIKNKEIAPYVDTFGEIVLMKNKPSKGKVLATSYNDKLNVTSWKLSNGITVLAKPTQLQNDLITMTGFRPGGSSTAPDSLYVSARNAGDIISSSGINGISAINLDKLNSGKTVSVQPRINFYEELFSGSSSSKDFETMMQMTYLYFTAPNKNEGIFDTKKEKMLALYQNQDASPDFYFEKKKAEIMTQNNLRGMVLSEKQVSEELDLDAAFDFYKERFASANGFTFIFVGSFELDSLKNTVTQYLGSLPSNLKEKSHWNDFGLRRPKGIMKETFYKGSEEKSKVDINFTGTLDFSVENELKITLLGKLLKIKLTEQLREKMSGVYGVQVSGYSTNKPYEWYRFNIRFTCAPENVEKLKNSVFEEIENIKKNGVSEIDLHKIKEAELANHKFNQKYNAYWNYKLKNSIENGLHINRILNFENEINSLTSDDFKATANTYFDSTNMVELILMPEHKQ